MKVVSCHSISIDIIKSRCFSRLYSLEVYLSSRVPNIFIFYLSGYYQGKLSRDKTNPCLV